MGELPGNKIKEAIAEALDNWEFIPCNDEDMVNDIYSHVREALIDFIGGGE